jgi:hypothetical protein
MKRFVYIPALICLLFACTERVDMSLDMDGDPKLVVFGELTNEMKAHTVCLSKSTPYFSEEKAPAVTGAKVTVSDGRSTVLLKEDPANPGTYRTPRTYKGIPGNTYRLEITAVDINEDGVSESYSAETLMPRTMDIESMMVYYNPEYDEWDVALFAVEPAETKDFYLFKVYKNGVLFTDSLSNYRIYDDKFFNGKELSGVIVQYFDREKGETVENGDEITLEIAGITEDYFKFIDAIKEETDGKYPLFSGPAANPAGNITNGALGFFSAMEINKASLVYHGN